MTREERIAWARQHTADTADEWKKEREQAVADRARRLAALGPAGAERQANELMNDLDIKIMGPVKTPVAWATARQAVREAAIDTARRRTTMTYGEMAIIAYEATGMKLGSLMYPNMCEDINRREDGCLLSAIIVRQDTGRPGDGFLPYARSQGFDAPLPTLQRMVYERFGEGR